MKIGNWSMKDTTLRGHIIRFRADYIDYKVYIYTDRNGGSVVRMLPGAIEDLIIGCDSDGLNSIKILTQLNRIVSKENFFIIKRAIVSYEC